MKMWLKIIENYIAYPTTFYIVRYDNLRDLENRNNPKLYKKTKNILSFFLFIITRKFLKNKELYKWYVSFKFRTGNYFTGI